MKFPAFIACLLALCGAAAARSLTTPNRVGREILQASADCARSVPNCQTCRFQKSGTVTTTICTQCATGYVVKNNGRGCWCAAGFKNSGTSCVPCGQGLAAGTYAYCVGSKTTLASATATICGANKLTTTALAKSEKECYAAPGYGWVAGDGVAAVQCAPGWFNPGQNNRQCTRCPGGLTTAAPGATSASACAAPAGYYYYRGKAVPCAQGTYKTNIANVDCTACPIGATTTGTTSVAPTACTVVKPGFSMPAGTVGVTDGAPCAADTFRSGTATYTGAAISCSACNDGLTTNGAPGSTSSSVCVAKPGYGYNAQTSSASPCVVGTYNEGYNKEPCDACGTGITTAAPGSVNSQSCLIPAGYGTDRNTATGELSAAPCKVNTYGRDDTTAGLVDVECTKCIDNTHTAGTGSTSPEACLTNTGYGYDDGAANLCDYASWSAGNSAQPCAYCGDGKNTSDPAAPTVPAKGGQSAAWCVTAAGWTTDGAGGIKPCIKGTFKDVLGDSACTTCATWGLTTSTPFGANERSDCDTCLPGYGNAAGAFTDLINNGCTKCASGFFSAGGAQGGAACDACPTSADYTGLIVSRPGSVTSDSCVRQFPTSDTVLSNSLEWDVLPMDASALTLNPNITDLAACQDACAADNTCQYFAFYNYGTNRCYLRTAAAAISKISADVRAPGSSFYIMLEVKESQYVTYSALSATDAGGVGSTISTFPSFDAARDACDHDARCAGFANTAADTWRTFAGTKWENAVGKVRAVGDTINSWIA